VIEALLVQQHWVISCQRAESNFLMNSQQHGEGYLYGIEPQLVAEAFAALHQNNGICRSASLPMLTSERMPGIVKIGSAIFLLDSWKRLYQPRPTLQKRRSCFQIISPVPDSAHHADHGKWMRPLENRRIVLQCFEEVCCGKFYTCFERVIISDFDGFWPS